MGRACRTGRGDYGPEPFPGDPTLHHHPPSFVQVAVGTPSSGEGFSQLPPECGVDELGSYWGRGIVMGLVGVQGGGA